MMKHLGKTLLGSAALLVLGCALSPAGGGGGGGEKIRILTWNLQTLYDGEESGREYQEFRAAGGWNEEKYAARITAFAAALGSLAEAPDILALQEVENAGILEDLGRQARGEKAKKGGQGYGWSAFACNPGMSQGVGVLSRFPLSRIAAHSAGDIPRPVLEVRVDAGENALVLMVCHWKSKLGGEEATEGKRRAAAALIRRRLEELAVTDPAVPVIILGDLNENHDEFYRQDGAFVSALLPDDPGAAALLQTREDRRFLVVSGEKPPAAAHVSGGVALYSPWYDGLEGGSYYYQRQWETIDHFLLSAALFDRVDWDFGSCRVVNEAPFTTAQGFPARYNAQTGAGLSDHLPLLLVLTR